MYLAGVEHPNREPSRHLLEQVQRGKVSACTSTEVLQEILYRYTSLGRHSTAREVYNLFVEICPVVHPITLADTDRARDLLQTVAGISARDAIHAAVMLNHKVTSIATFDKGFDQIPGIQRAKL